MTTKRIKRPEARVLAEEEFVRFADLAASLTPDEWATPTDCTGWDVRTMVLHVLGSADAQASFPQFLHQLRRGMPLNKEIDSHHWVDGLNELQIRERSHLSNDEVAAQVQSVGPNAVKGRWGTPPPMPCSRASCQAEATIDPTFASRRNATLSAIEDPLPR